MRRRQKKLMNIILFLVSLVIFCEYGIYYVVIFQVSTENDFFFHHVLYLIIYLLNFGYSVRGRSWMKMPKTVQLYRWNRKNRLKRCL